MTFFSTYYYLSLQFLLNWVLSHADLKSKVFTRVAYLGSDSDEKKSEKGTTGQSEHLGMKVLEHSCASFCVRFLLA